MIARAARPLIAILLLAAAQALAQAPQTAFLDELTWTEVRDQVRAGRNTIIIPIGGTEQSGPYIALGKHNARVRILSEKIALALGNALVAPVIAYVPEGAIYPATAHMRFPGTISIPARSSRRFSNTRRAAFQAHGFRDIRVPGRSRRLPEGRKGSRRPAQSRMGRHADSGPCLAGILSRRQRGVRRSAAQARLSRR